jgi:hypothetical protein
MSQGANEPMGFSPISRAVNQHISQLSLIFGARITICLILNHFYEHGRSYNA